VNGRWIGNGDDDDDVHALELTCRGDDCGGRRTCGCCRQCSARTRWSADVVTWRATCRMPRCCRHLAVSLTVVSASVVCRVALHSSSTRNVQLGEWARLNSSVVCRSPSLILRWTGSTDSPTKCTFRTVNGIDARILHQNVTVTAVTLGKLATFSSFSRRLYSTTLHYNVHIRSGRQTDRLTPETDWTHKANTKPT